MSPRVKKQKKNVSKVKKQTNTRPKAKRRKKGSKPRIPKGKDVWFFEENWSLENIEEFIEALMDLTLCDDIEELKNHTIPEFIWKKLEKKFQVDHTLMKSFWIYKLHQQLFCPEPVYMNDLKIKLIDLLHEKQKQSKTPINWHNMAKHFDGCTKEFLKRICTNLVRDAKIAMECKDQSTLIKWLYNVHTWVLIKLKEDRILPRLKYNEGKLEAIDEIDYQLSLNDSES